MGTRAVCVARPGCGRDLDRPTPNSNHSQFPAPDYSLEVGRWEWLGVGDGSSVQDSSSSRASRFTVRSRLPSAVGRCPPTVMCFAAVPGRALDRVRGNRPPGSGASNLLTPACVCCAETGCYTHHLMRSVADALRDDSRRQTAALSPEARVARALALGDADVEALCESRGVGAAEARAIIARARRLGRRPSRAHGG